MCVLVEVEEVVWSGERLKISSVFLFGSLSPRSLDDVQSKTMICDVVVLYNFSGRATTWNSPYDRTLSCYWTWKNSISILVNSLVVVGRAVFAIKDDLIGSSPWMKFSSLGAPVRYKLEIEATADDIRWSEEEKIEIIHSSYAGLKMWRKRNGKSCSTWQSTNKRDCDSIFFISSYLHFFFFFFLTN